MAKMMTVVVGARYYEGVVKATAKLKKGEEVLLIRETNNPHDKNAVTVHTIEGQKLGYVPRQDAPAVAKVLDSEVPCKATVRVAGSTSIDIIWES